MIRSALRWLFFSVALFLAGPLCWRLVCLIPASDGGLAAGATLSVAPFRAMLATIAAFAIAGLCGCAGARFFTSERTGLFSAGLALAWTPWSVARLDELARSTGSLAMFPLALEGAFLGLLGIALAWLIHASRLRPIRLLPEPGAFSPRSARGLLGPAVALAVGAACAWAVARSNEPGQGLAAGVAAALFGTLVGRIIDADTDDRAFFISAALLAVASPLLAAQGAGAGGGVGSVGAGLVEQVYSGAIFPTARVMPIDWIAGALLGVPLGSAWAASMIEKRTHPTALSPQA